jgi:hypothetical protein
VQVRQEVGHTLVIVSTTIGNIGDRPLVVQGQTVTMPDGQQKTRATQIVMKTDRSRRHDPLIARPSVAAATTFACAATFRPSIV